MNQKKGTEIDVKRLSQRLGCPVIETVSISGKGLKTVVSEAVKLKGRTQKPPYTQADIDFSDKNAVELEDRKRFTFVSEIIQQVENRQTLTKDKTLTDTIDMVLTNRVAGLLSFAAVMYGVLDVYKRQHSKQS